MALLIMFLACSSKSEPAKDSKAGQNAAAIKSVENQPVPAYMKKTIDHFKNITELMKENLYDCKTALNMVSRYIEENRADIENAIKLGDEAQRKMTEEEKAIFAWQVKNSFSPIIQEVGKISAEYVRKCKSEVKQLSELLKSLGGQSGG